MAGNSFAAKASHQAQLQRALGERGVVLPRVVRGSANHPAQGWYATIDGQDVFIGDHTAVAFVKIAHILNGKGP